MSVEACGDEPRARRTENADLERRRQGVAGACTRVGVAAVRLWRLCEEGSVDLAGELSAARQEAARTVGGVGALVRSRPGSWDASDLRHLACSDEGFGW